MKNIFQVYLVLFVFTFGAVQAQPKVKQQNVTIESVVKDDQGNPVPGALIYGKEGAVIVKTDASGHFTISVPVGSGLLIESEGYESKVLSQEELKSGVSLKPTPYLMGEKDNVHIAFGTVKRGDLTGDVSVVEPDEFVDYDNSQYVPDALAGRIPGMFGSNNIPGVGRCYGGIGWDSALFKNLGYKYQHGRDRPGYGTERCQRSRPLWRPGA
ncbi:MAG: carboxypeptidase-like regulatory domain-containing protein [Bacteroidetes bacterium]|nr:carboxypeptidase-like regulatory domain-containing protein [Bacteroidota bacterium]